MSRFTTDQSVAFAVLVAHLALLLMALWSRNDIVLSNSTEATVMFVEASVSSSSAPSQPSVPVPPHPAIPMPAPVAAATVEPIAAPVAVTASTPTSTAPATPAAPSAQAATTNSEPSLSSASSSAASSESAFVPVDVAAAYASNPLPPYPTSAQWRKQAGVVVLSVLVMSNGRVRDVQVAKSSGYAVLDEAAATSVRRWKLKPAMRGFSPIESTVNIPVRYDLR